jgi:hypothetical protein
MTAEYGGIFLLGIFLQNEDAVRGWVLKPSLSG